MAIIMRMSDHSSPDGMLHPLVWSSSGPEVFEISNLHCRKTPQSKEAREKEKEIKIQKHNPELV